MKQIKREKSTANAKGFYVRNADLLPVVIEDKANGKVSDKLIKMIYMIAERYSRKHNFVNYSFREDMVAAAVLNLCNNALKFNPERSETPNPFSFYTTAIHNSFLQYITEEKKHRQIRDQLLLDAGSNPSFNFQERGITDSDTGGFSGGFVMEIPEESPKEEKEAKLQAQLEAMGQDPDAEAEGRKLKVVKKEVPYRLQHREPVGGVTYAASEMVYDEELGYFVKKEVEAPKKKTRAKKVSA